MPSPKISVIVPIYNAEKWLRRCVDSILAQTYTDLELLLIDDGSTDGSSAICDAYATLDTRVRVFHKPNGGASSARNVGLDNVHGEWITFCDSDDWVYSDWIENFNINNSERYDLICQGIECDKPMSEGEECSSQYKYSFNFEGDIIKALNSLYHYKILGYTFIKAFRLNIIKEHGLSFDTNIKLQEDEVFLFQYIKFARSIRVYDKVGYHYYIPEWNTKYKLNFEDREYLLLKSIAELSKLDNKRSIDIIKYRRIELSQLYYTKFCTSPQKRKYCVSQLHKILKEDFRNSQIFYLSRIIIRLDASNIIALALLKCHLSLKKMIFLSKNHDK